MTPTASKWLRRGAVTLMGMVVLAGAGLWLGTQLAERKMQRKIDVKVQPVALLDLGNTVAIERGRYLYASRGCADCHGGNGGGRCARSTATV
jgi:cytochrome c